MQVLNDYWRDFSDQEIGSKPLDKIEIEVSSGVWTDFTDYYLGGGTFDQEKEREADKITASDTRYSFENSDGTFDNIIQNNLYIGKKIKFLIGFHSIGYKTQSIMFIKDVELDFEDQICYIHAQDILQRLIDEDINAFPNSLVPVAGSNTGNGVCSEVATYPSNVKAENWTLTCNLGGGDGVATFTVTGSVSGLVGTATSGTEFIHSARGIRFTLTVGIVNWLVGDSFTFSTINYPKWTLTNPVKIIWSILTGKNWDTGAIENFSSSVFAFDSTQTDSNTDINYSSFSTALSAVSDNLSGYVPYDKNAAECLEEIILHFLGTITTDTSGRISLFAYRPTFGNSLIVQEFSDDKKVFSLNGTRATSNMINSVTVKCKKSDATAWSNASEQTNDLYSASNSTSISIYGIRNPFIFEDLYWYSANHSAQRNFADKIIDKYGAPPLELEFETGLDGIRTDLGKIISFTDTRSSFTKKLLEVISISKDFEATPKQITLSVSNTGTIGLNWSFLGSSVGQGDGLSPQNASWDSASASDKQFCYLSQTGATSDPRYYLF